MKPYYKNPRKISESEKELLQESLDELGDLSGIVHDLNSDQIVGGNQRSGIFDINACEIVITEQYDAPDRQGTVAIGYVIWRGAKYAYRQVRWTAERCERANIRANKLGGEWDFAVLLRDFERSVVLDSGFKEDELAVALAGLAAEVEKGGEGEGNKDAEPQTNRAEELREKWGVETGQLWRLPSRVAGQEHRLICGDCTDRAVVERVMGGEVADMGVTSPPYNQHIDQFKPSGMHKEGDWVSKVERLAYRDSLPESEYQDSQRKAIHVWFGIFKDGASFFYNHKNRYREKQVVSPLQWLPGDFRFRQEIVWSRPGSVTQNARMFIPSDERIYWLYKGKDFYFDDSTEIKSYSTVWSIKLETNKDHAVAFPPELPTRCIQACSTYGQIVFEPYSGSGTTIIAAENLSRQCRAIEISPAYVAVALQRYQDAFNITPELIG